MLIKNLKNTNLNLHVGIFSDATARRSANGSKADNLAYRYKIHDKGLGRNPKRETLEPAFSDSMDNDKYVKAIFDDLDKEYLDRKLQNAGKRMAANVKDHIVKLRSPAKTKVTIDQSRRRYGRARSNPLIQTAEMKNAVKYKVIG